ncbi:MAG: Exo-glucosaminidase LytG [Flavobacteriales bacterium]|nr:MAG: Exo-glucosaminidase LytG [Flavobacteriales bacterium]
MKNFFLFLVIILVSSCSSLKQTTNNESSVEEKINIYIKKYAPAATKNMRFFKIPASITLAQGILESGYGEGTLAKNANNHFGIKCHKDWKGKSIKHDDDEKNECFRSYKNPLRSYRDHSLFLVDRDRYSSLFELNRKDYRGWALGLKAAGYATDPKYADKLISLIERFKLTRFDE